MILSSRPMLLPPSWGGQLATGATYDDNGNRFTQPTDRVTALGYNPANQPMSIDASSGAVAQSLARIRQGHWHSGAGLTFTSAGSFQITDKYIAPNEYLAPNWNYDQTRMPDGTLVDTTARVGTSTATDYYLFDRQGSVVGLTDANGQVAHSYAYDLWGNTTLDSGSAANFFGYHSSPSIGSLHKFGTRWYNSKTGAWTQTDPQPSANLYTYAGDNPINNTDPSGRTFLCGNDWVHSAWCPGAITWPFSSVQQGYDFSVCAAGIIMMDTGWIGAALAAYGCGGLVEGIIND